MRARHRGDKTYYYLDTGAKPRKEIPLGRDYVLAIQKWAELTVSGDKAGALVTFRHVAERYQREVLPGKAPATRKDNLFTVDGDLLNRAGPRMIAGTAVLCEKLELARQHRSK